MYNGHVPQHTGRRIFEEHWDTQAITNLNNFGTYLHSTVACNDSGSVSGPKLRQSHQMASCSNGAPIAARWTTLGSRPARAWGTQPHCIDSAAPQPAKDDRPDSRVRQVVLWAILDVKGECRNVSFVQRFGEPTNP